MRNTNKVFHLAIPCRELNETAEFYEKLGCRTARRYEDRVTLDFFGDQVVCHLSPSEIDEKPSMYPRHFGITFTEEEEFHRTYQQAKEQALPLFQDLMVRFKGKREEHITFFLADPSNNLLEFKYYHDPEMVY
ncbi:VOC family protein [Peribacillus sp. SCS-37]|uniref:VOC family protein n=1 Tax=Paraperibacillus esterisolvens TaxID=3115296 RepID=UPI003905E55D